MRFNKAVFLLFVLCCASLLSHARELPEYQIKAAYIYNIMKFVQWSKEGNLLVGVLGKNPFGNVLDQMQKKQIADRAITVVYSDSIDKLLACDVIYMNVVDYDKVFKALEGRGVLTIGDSKDFLNSGGMIQFVMEDRKINMAINNHLLKKEGIMISSKLLNSSFVELYHP